MTNNNHETAEIFTVTRSAGDVLWVGQAVDEESAWCAAMLAAGYDHPEREPDLCGTPANYTYERVPGFFVVVVSGEATEGPFEFYFGDEQLVFASESEANDMRESLAVDRVFGSLGDKRLDEVGANYAVYGPYDEEKMRTGYPDHCAQADGGAIEL